jgi:hypothetical protein
MHCKLVRLAALCIAFFALCTTLFVAVGAAPGKAAPENIAYTDAISEAYETDTLVKTVSAERSTMKRLTTLFTVLSIILLVATIALLVSTVLTLKRQRKDHK